MACAECGTRGAVWMRMSSHPSLCWWSVLLRIKRLPQFGKVEINPQSSRCRVRPPCRLANHARAARAPARRETGLDTSPGPAGLVASLGSRVARIVLASADAGRPAVERPGRRCAPGPSGPGPRSSSGSSAPSNFAGRRPPIAAVHHPLRRPVASCSLSPPCSPALPPPRPSMAALLRALAAIASSPRSRRASLWLALAVQALRLRLR